MWIEEDSIAAWEDEGGSHIRSVESAMTGSVNQIAWALQIRRQVDAEFDRVRKALESVARNDPNHSPSRTIITILEDKRAEVMRRSDAGYFIHDWQELGGQVRQMIIADSRYQAIKLVVEKKVGLTVH